MTTTPEYGLPLPPDSTLIATFPKMVRDQSAALESTLDAFSRTITDWKGWLREDVDLDTITEAGRYGTVASSAMGLAATTVSVIGTVILQDTITADGRALHRSYAPSQGWTEWRPLGGPQRLVTSTQNPLVFANLDNGEYQITRTADGTALGLPTIDHGILRVNRWNSVNGRPGMATWTTKPTSLGATEIWTTEIAADGTAVAWTLATGSGRDQPAPAASGPDMGVRHQYVADRHAAALGGTIDVGAATPVAITWDDYPGSFKAHGVAALAAQYEIPMTLAIPSKALDAGYEHLVGDTSAGVTWAEIDGWVQDGWIELANHSATHRSTITDAELEDEIVTALADLQAKSPTKPITTWVMPDNSWAGLDEGRTADGWASQAGAMILGHHAFATGKHSIESNHSVPMTGIPFQGANRRWIEAEGLTDAVRQNLVASSYGTNRGVILGAHPAWIGQGTRWTLTEVETFLAWLADERDAGRVRPMFLSEWPWARVTV